MIETARNFVIVKTRQTANSINHMNTLVAKYGRLTMHKVEHDDSDSFDRFKTYIANPNERLQLLNHAAAINSPTVMYCECTMDAIQRIVFIDFDDKIVESFRDAIRVFKNMYLGFAYDNGDIPDDPNCNYGYCSDRHTLQLDLALWKALRDLRTRQDDPLRTCYKIVPSLVAAWNRGKCGVDSGSRFLASANFPFKHICPEAVLWDSLIMIMALMVHLVHKWMRVKEKVRDEQYETMNDLRNYANHHDPFKMELNLMQKLFRRWAGPLGNIAEGPAHEEAHAYHAPVNDFEVPTSGRSTIKQQQFETDKGFAFRQTCGGKNLSTDCTRTNCFICGKKIKCKCPICQVHLHSGHCSNVFHTLKILPNSKAN